MSLGKLFRKYRCDKGTKHNYHKVYSELWESLRDKPINFLEIGIFEGLSTKAFLEYFPKAKFYGIDIFTRLTPEDVPVLNNRRVKWIKGDSMHHNIRSQIKKNKVKVSDEIYKYVIEIEETIKSLDQNIHVSARCLKQIIDLAKGWAVVHGKDYVTHQEIKDIIPYIFRHRIKFLNQEDKLNYINEEILSKISIQK